MGIISFESLPADAKAAYDRVASDLGMVLTVTSTNESVADCDYVVTGTTPTSYGTIQTWDVRLVCYEVGNLPYRTRPNLISEV